MKTLSRSFFALTLLGLAACSDAPPPQPYRGELMATLTVSPELKRALEKRHGYVDGNNCVQLVGRDNTKDGIRHVQTVVIFSPDECPAQPGKVAEREAFHLEATREPLVPSGMGGGLYPAIAYRLVLNAPNVHEEVGTVLLVDEIDSEDFETPKEPVYQLGDVCTLSLEYEEMCGLIFTKDGRFNQVDSARAAIGKRKRERRVADGLKRHMDEMRNVLSTQLNDVQKNLVVTMDNRLQALQVALRNEQRMLAAQMVEDLEARIDDLAIELNANENAAAKTVIEELRREMRTLHAENLRVLRAEIRAAVSELKSTLSDVQAELVDRMDHAEAVLLNRINYSAKKLEANITGHQRRIVLALYMGLTSDLDRLATRIENKVESQTTRAIRASRRAMREYADEILKSIREEVLCQATAFEHAVNQRFAEILTDKGSLREQIGKILDSQTKSAAVLADELPKLREELGKLSKATGVAVDKSMERILARLEAALDEETQAAEIVARSILDLQLAAAKKVWIEQKTADKEADAVKRFDEVLGLLQKGGTPAEQLKRTEELRELVVKLARASGDLDEAQSAAVNNVRITLRDYATTALRLEHRALVRELLPLLPRDPKVADRWKRDVPRFAAAKFADRARLALDLAATIENERDAKVPGLVERLEGYAKAVEAEQKLRDRVSDLKK